MSTATFWLSPTDSRWRRAADSAICDIYHLPAYTAIDASMTGGEARAFVWQRGGSSMLIPLIYRHIPGAASKQYLDATSPYGYSGPAFSATMTPDEMSNALSAFKRAGAKQNLVCSFLRLHPWHNEGLADAINDPDMLLVQRGQVVAIDLRRNLSELPSIPSSNHRRNIRKLGAAGYRAIFNDWSYYEAFMALYKSTMRRVNAQQYYFFNREYFSQLRTQLGDALTFCCVLAPDDEVAAVGLFSHVGEVVQYLLGGTSPAHLKAAPSKLMFAESIGHFQRKDRSWLNLGGGVGTREDSLYRFKRGFGTDVKPFYTLGIIHDRAEYDRLNALEGAHEDTTFFPPYRDATTTRPGKLATAVNQTR